MQNKILIYFYNIKISEQTLKFSDIVVNKKEIVVPDKFKHNDGGSKYFIGYLHDDDVIRPLCIILPQMSGYIKYFDNGGKNMSFKIEDESAYLKYTEIWNKIKKSLSTRFYSQHIYDCKYIKNKVKKMINTVFSGNEIPKERNNYIYISAISIDSVLKVDKKNYPQAYLEQPKYKRKKKKPVDLIDAEVDLSLGDSDD